MFTNCTMPFLSRYSQQLTFRTKSINQTLKLVTSNQKQNLKSKTENRRTEEPKTEHLNDKHKIQTQNSKTIIEEGGKENLIRSEIHIHDNFKDDYSEHIRQS